MQTDEQLQHDIAHELHDQLHIFDVEVIVTDGFVTLKEKNLTAPEKIGARKAVEEIEGVKAIIETPEESYAAGLSNNDEELARRAYEILQRNAPGEVMVRVSAGCIYLEGEVDWQSQRSDLGMAVWHTKGVKGICNLIRLKSDR